MQSSPSYASWKQMKGRKDQEVEAMEGTQGENIRAQDASEDAAQTQGEHPKANTSIESKDGSEYVPKDIGENDPEDVSADGPKNDKKMDSKATAMATAKEKQKYEATVTDHVRDDLGITLNPTVLRQRRLAWSEELDNYMFYL
jgi:hypothetical protein